MTRVVYTPQTADHVRSTVGGDEPLTWLAYLGFDHAHPQLSNVELRRALALAIDRSALAEAAPANLVAATGGVVPPALSVTRRTAHPDSTSIRLESIFGVRGHTGGGP